MSSKYDTKSIFEIETVENIIKHITDLGVQTVVIKSAQDKGYFVNSQGNTNFIPFYTENIVDSTSSGDAFNGAYLHAIANGYSAPEVARIASIDAGLQAQGIGQLNQYHIMMMCTKFLKQRIFNEKKSCFIWIFWI